MPRAGTPLRGKGSLGKGIAFSFPLSVFCRKLADEYEWQSIPARHHGERPLPVEEYRAVETLLKGVEAPLLDDGRIFSIKMVIREMRSGFVGGLDRTPKERLLKPFSLPILAAPTRGSRHRVNGNRMNRLSRQLFFTGCPRLAAGADHAECDLCRL
jgi:hypothetical protein